MYKVDLDKYTARDLYLMWLIHIDPKQFLKDNNIGIAFRDHQGYAYLLED